MTTAQLPSRISLAACRRKPLAMVAVTALTIGFAGCSRHADVTGSIQPSPDYRERHPIVIADAPQTLSVYPVRGAGGLDLRQADDLRVFAADFRLNGRGIVTLAVPQNGRAAAELLPSVRQALVRSGVPARLISVAAYHPDGETGAAPLRLSFTKLQAKVDSLCGQWWTDFNGAATSATFTNQSPPNFGCAYQTSIAAQVANPVDLERPRQETDIDVPRRAKDVDTLRQHKDPSTQWKTNAGQVGSTGSGG